MTPTMRLRFVERTELCDDGDLCIQYKRITKILQQWWEPMGGYDSTLPAYRAHGEWRDVEVEEETK